ncbi:MAG: hypothetical protein OXQ84_20495 [bacterium]|nr:hypothetical protein [bacterium]
MDDTGWGTVTELKDGLPKYNNHFARFRGVVSFDCEDSGKMPWNTTKTGLDDSTVVWQRTYEKMRDHARSVVSFLNALANEIAEYGSDASPMLAALESETRLRDVGEFPQPESRFSWNENPPEVGPKMKNILYRKEEEKIEALKEVFGVTSGKAVGEKSFDLAYDVHVEDDQ